MKSLIIVAVALLLIIALPFTFIAIDNAITDTYEQTISGVTTGAGSYNATVTLGRALYNEDAVSITSISSNVTSESPSAASYNTVNHQVVVTGLEANKTHTLAFTFLIDNTTLPDGMTTVVTVLRWFWVFAIVGTIIGAIYAWFVT